MLARSEGVSRVRSNIVHATHIALYIHVNRMGTGGREGTGGFSGFTRFMSPLRLLNPEVAPVPSFLCQSRVNTQLLLLHMDFWSFLALTLYPYRS